MDQVVVPSVIIRTHYGSAADLTYIANIQIPDWPTKSVLPKIEEIMDDFKCGKLINTISICGKNT